MGKNNCPRLKSQHEVPVVYNYSKYKVRSIAIIEPDPVNPLWSRARLAWLLVDGLRNEWWLVR